MTVALLQDAAASAPNATTVKSTPLGIGCLLGVLPAKRCDVFVLVISTYLTVRKTGTRAKPRDHEPKKL